MGARSTMERLQRILAARGVASRRAAEALITAGRVTVDGEVVTELGTKADPVRAEIRVDGQPLRTQRPRYLLLNKPRGYITTMKDERDRRTVMDIVSVPERVYPVGRLDRDTEGLLLLTNDGDVANRVMHPRYELDKEYHVLTLTRPTEAALQRVRNGVVVDGHRVVPHEFRILRQMPDGLILKMVIHEGTYHLVKRVMDTVGIQMERLRRVRVGPLVLTGLPVGAWRDLTPGEQTTLFEALRLDRDEADIAAARPAGPVEIRRSPRRPAKPAGQPATEPASERTTVRREDARRTSGQPASVRASGPTAGPRESNERQRSDRPGERERERERERGGDRQPYKRDEPGDRSRGRADGADETSRRAGDQRGRRQHRTFDDRDRSDAVPPGRRPDNARGSDDPNSPRRRFEHPGAPTSGRDGTRQSPHRGRDDRPDRPPRQRSSDDRRGSPPGDRDRRPGRGRKNNRGARPGRPPRRDVP